MVPQTQVKTIKKTQMRCPLDVLPQFAEEDEPRHIIICLIGRVYGFSMYCMQYIVWCVFW